MRSILFNLRVAVAVVAVGYHLPKGFTAAVSATTNGVYLAVGGVDRNSQDLTTTNLVIRPDWSLVFKPFCPTGRAEFAYPLNPAYSIKIRMVGPDRRPVSKTWEGRRWGSKFDKVRTYKDARVSDIMAGRSITENPVLAGGRILASPKDLFVIKKAGLYRMEFEMQMFRISREKDTFELIRFPPVTLSVEKPPDP